MLRFDAARSVRFCDGPTRRDFLHAGALATLGLTLPGFLAAKQAGVVGDRDVNCIMLGSPPRRKSCAATTPNC
jgi:hypothetical protein